MTINFEPAVRAGTAIILALAGASGSGKTKSALELAVGLAGSDGRILVIDSEGCRAKHYADDYEFYHYDWRPPYSPVALGELLKEAEQQKFAVIVVDSMSSEHEDEGGLCDMAEAELSKQRGENKNSAAAWARPKAEHKAKIVRWLRQTRCHVIFCLRADEKVRFEKVMKDGRERTVIVPLGWQPIAEKRLLYDVTTSLLFTPDRPGYPTPIKLYEKHARFFPADSRVSREAGRMLAEWAAGGKPPSPGEPLLADRARDAAFGGKDALSDLWKGLSQHERREIKDLVYGELAQIAKRVDEDREPLPDDPFGFAEQEHPGSSATYEEKGKPLTPVSPVQAAHGAPSASGVHEIEPAKVSGDYDWRSYATHVLQEYRALDKTERQALRAAQAQWLAALRSADRDRSTELMSAMADVDREERMKPE